MDVVEFLTHDIKFYNLFLVNELHELLCRVFLYIFRCFIVHAKHYFEFIITHSCYVIGQTVFVSTCFAIHIMTKLDWFGELYDVIFIRSL
jgi:hypothetical protein